MIRCADLCRLFPRFFRSVNISTEARGGGASGRGLRNRKVWVPYLQREFPSAARPGQSDVYDALWPVYQDYKHGRGRCWGGCQTVTAAGVVGGEEASAQKASTPC